MCLAPSRPEDTVGMMHTGPFLMRLVGRDPKVSQKNTRIWGYRQRPGAGEEGGDEHPWQGAGMSSPCFYLRS